MCVCVSIGSSGSSVGEWNLEWKCGGMIEEMVVEVVVAVVWRKTRKGLPARSPRNNTTRPFPSLPPTFVCVCVRDDHPARLPAEQQRGRNRRRRWWRAVRAHPTIITPFARADRATPAAASVARARGAATAASATARRYKCRPPNISKRIRVPNTLRLVASVLSSSRYLFFFFFSISLFLSLCLSHLLVCPTLSVRLYIYKYIYTSLNLFFRIIFLIFILIIIFFPRLSSSNRRRHESSPKTLWFFFSARPKNESARVCARVIFLPSTRDRSRIFTERFAVRRNVVSLPPDREELG